MARTLRTRASSSVKRPIRSYSRPSRMAPSATRTRSMPKFSTISSRIASPAGNTGARSASTSSRSRSSTWPAAIDALGERPQVVERDVRRIGIEPAQHVADDAHRAGTAECLQPAELAVGFLNGLEFQPHRRARPLEALLGDLAVVETAGAQADAAHRQALEQQRIEALADHDLGRAAADVDHQPLVRAHGARVRDAGVDQARLFQPGDDFDGVTERGAGALQEPALALGAAQRIGADDAHAVGVHGAQALAESFEAAQGAVGGGIVEPAAVAQAGGQAHHLAQPVEDDQLAVRVARDHHVKTVGAQIDGGEHVGNDTTAAHLRQSYLGRE